MISIEKVSLVLRGKTLLEDVSLKVCRGEYLAIIGPNGAGKTTLLRIIDGMIPEWTGEILFLGKSLRSFSRKQTARKIAFVQQSNTIPFAFTVRQVIEMGRYPHLKPLSPLGESDAKIITEAMHQMEVAELASRLFETLSGGERQRVFLAAALVQEPEILLLDEPATYLDYKHQAELSTFLRKINREQGTTIIEVTHDVNRAVLDATHIVALRDAKIVFDGPPKTLMHHDRLQAIYGAGFCLVAHPHHELPMVLPEH